MKRADLLQIRNFGAKSLTELYDRLRVNDLLPPELDPDIEQEAPEEEDGGGEDLVAVAADASEDEGSGEES